MKLLADKLDEDAALNAMNFSKLTQKDFDTLEKTKKALARTLNVEEVQNCSELIFKKCIVWDLSKHT